jgi:hypothetical protein
MANGKTGDNIALTRYVANQKFLNIFGLSELTGLTPRNIRTLVHKRAIPYIKVGHRTHLFQPEKVARALEKFELKASLTETGGNERTALTKKNRRA